MINNAPRGNINSKAQRSRRKHRGVPSAERRLLNRRKVVDRLQRVLVPAETGKRLRAQMSRRKHIGVPCAERRLLNRRKVVDRLQRVLVPGACDLVELRIAKPPSPFVSVPIFANPVVLPAFGKIGGETAAEPGRRAGRAQERAERQRKVATGAETRGCLTPASAGNRLRV